jgi:hypothetical protein
MSSIWELDLGNITNPDHIDNKEGLNWNLIA